MNLTDKLLVSQDIVFQEVGGEYVLLDLASGTYFGLDAVGGRLWTLLQDKALTLSELHDLLLQEYDVPSETLKQDLLAITKDLVDNKLLYLKQ